MAAGVAGAAAVRAAQRAEQLGLPPDRGEPARVADVAGPERVVDGERAGVHVADRVDQADHPAGTAQVEAGHLLPERGEVEERVAGQHALAVRHQPVVQLALLRRGGVQLVPDVGAPTGRAQPGQPELGAVPVGDRLEGVQLAEVVPGGHDRELEPGEPGVGQVLHRGHGDVVGARPADRVVHLRRRAVEGELHVDVVARRQPGRGRPVDPDAVGGELHPDPVLGGVVDQLPEVRADGRFAATDVDVEDLHPLQLVDHRLALGGAQLARVPPAGAGQAVHAGQVAGVGELPGQADRRVQAELEQVDQPRCGGGRHQRLPQRLRGTSIEERARPVSAAT